MAIKQPSTSKPHKKTTQNSTQQRLFIAFQYIEDLTAVNECSYEVYQQLKIDRCNLNDTSNLTQAIITSPSISVILRKNQAKKYLIKFHHGALFSPVQSTLVKVITNGHLLTWPGLYKI